MNPKPDDEGIIRLLEESNPVLDLPPSNLPAEPAQSLCPVITVAPEEEWEGEPTGVAWEKVRKAFFSSKSAFEIKAYAMGLTVGAWLDTVLRMAPKDVKVSGEVSLKHVLAELGPIDKDKYRVTGLVEDVEFSEVR